MAASRIASSRRLCCKYRYIFYIAFVILCIQFILYNFNIKDTEIPSGDKPKDDTLEKPEDRDIVEEPLGEEKEEAVIVDHDRDDSHPTEVLTSEESHNLSGEDPRHKMGFLQDFIPPCTIESAQALSAIKRAKTKECKQEIADTACGIQEGGLYPGSLPNTCHLKGNHSKGHYYGCYVDNPDDRDFSHQKTFPTENWSQLCIDYCIQTGFRYAGLQYGRECWCGNSFGKHGTEGASCNQACPAKTSEMCGGYLTSSVYSTGIQERLSNGPGDLHFEEDIQPKVRVMFVLTLSGRQVRQVRRLLKAIYHRDHFYLLHVDMRQEYLYRELLPLEDVLPNVHLVRKRFATIWGGANLLDAHLHIMKEALNSYKKWDYYVNLSESDYPIKRLDALISYLTKYKGYVFIKSHGRNTALFLRKQGLDQTFLQCDHHLWRLGPRTLPTGIQMDGGSDWVGLPRQFCEFVTTSEDKLLTGLKKLYKYTLLPVESFFHTLLHNSHYCDKWMENNLHVTNWDRKRGCKCQHKNVVDWCGCSPNDFLSKDLDRILSIESKPVFFGRKFEPSVNQDIINSMDVNLFGSEMRDVTALTDYWQNEYHYLDSGARVDDTYLSFYLSFMRLTAARLVADTATQCQVVPEKLLQVHIFQRSDRNQGLLVMFEAITRGGAKVVLESHVMMRQYYSVIDPPGPAGRLINIEVGTDYDLKESIFRNYGLFLGPYSDLVLKHTWGPGEPLMVSIAWIDPAKVIAASYDVNITSEGQIKPFKPLLKQPLRPGVWTSKLMYRWQVFAEVKFLVLPLTVFRGKTLDPSKAILHHNGPIGYYAKQDFSEFEEVLKVTNIGEARAAADENGQKHGRVLEEWTDELCQKFWSIQEVCQIGEITEECSPIKKCEETSWSSMSPDPKSTITGVNLETGLIR
ncbi:LOW QUALITY PROTEIN: xylosyltransferase oxt-like [Saccostrea cucullata]|uniref:LOW QUALITY PROTEIN: xylosyltransferase oxt-like n=1 Tax=Saccostrea cuccullata TaxID=36930 RepID=UPI002ED3295E